MHLNKLGGQKSLFVRYNWWGFVKGLKMYPWYWWQVIPEQGLYTGYVDTYSKDVYIPEETEKNVK